MHKTITLRGLSLLFAGALALGACSRPTDQQGGQAGNAQATLTIKGSDTMVDLVSLWNEAYTASHPEADVTMSGGGSGTGIAALINGTTDICMSSRDVKEEEREQAKAKGKELVEHPVAMDGLAIVVNPANPVESLTIEQLGKIYTGAVTNWNQVGGPDQPIQVLSRESSSGTYIFFQEHVMDKKNYTEQARLLSATSAIVQSVQTDAWTIGYVGLGYAHNAGGKVKVLTIKKDETSPAVVPSEATVHSGEYAIARKLYFYTAGAPTPAQQDYIAFCTGPEGRAIVQESGYIPLAQ